MTLHKDLEQKKQPEQKTASRPFEKPDDHFIYASDSSILHESYHHIFYFKKAPRKDGSGSNKRNKTRWLTIVNDTVIEDSDNRKRLNDICVLVMRLLRLSNLITPKTCIFQGMLMSQEIPGSVDFSEHYDRVINTAYSAEDEEDEEEENSPTPFKQNDYEDLGRSVTDAYYYGQDDGRYANFLFHNERVIVIDPDRCLGWVTLPFHRDKPRTVDCSLCLPDFEDLPRIHLTKRMNWDWNKTPGFSGALAKSKKFRAGKHFTALKHVLLFDTEIDMVKAHIDHEKDKENIIKFLSARHLELKSICKQSARVNLFLEEERRTLIKVIFYELNLFFREYPYYGKQNTHEAEQEWEKIVDKILDNYVGLLKLTSTEELSKQEFEAIQKYALDVRNNERYTLDEAKAFYEKHEMHKRAQEVMQFAETLKSRATDKKADKQVPLLTLPPKGQGPVAKPPSFFPAPQPTPPRRSQSLPVLQKKRL